MANADLSNGGHLSKEVKEGKGMEGRGGRDGMGKGEGSKRYDSGERERDRRKQSDKMPPS